jgi:carboxyl-terminal processing protease
VRLQVTTGSAPPRVVELQRRHTELQDSRASGTVAEQDGARIGWIELPGFYGGPEGSYSASRDVAAILRDFGAQRVDVVVLDLRNNGGGLLNEATALTGLFLDTGNVVQVQGQSGEVLRHDDDDPGAAWTGPLVVLINRFSASASEIVAGAIADQGRGIVVGDTSTHGKGTVQTVIDLAETTRRRGVAGALKLTVQQFFRPGGDSTQLRGVRSDVVLPSLTEAIAEGEGALPNALPFAHIAPAAVIDSARRDRAMIARLQLASQRRCEGDPDFRRVAAGTAQRQQWTAQKVVPLQQQAFADYRSVLQQLRAGAGKDRLPWYTAEVRRVARDYAYELRGKRAI